MPSESSPPQQSFHPFYHLTPDCLHVVFQFYLFRFFPKGEIPERRSWYNIGRMAEYGYNMISQAFGLHSVQGSDSLSNFCFLSKYASCCLFCGNAWMEFFRQLREMGIVKKFQYLSLDIHSLDLNQVSLDYIVPHLRGITELDLDLSLNFHAVERYLSDVDALFFSLRGVTKLSLCVSYALSLSEMNLMNLRGIQELRLDYCNFSTLPPNIFQHFRGVKRLQLHFCSLHPSGDWLRDIRGIEELEIVRCSNMSLSNKDFSNIRGIRKLFLNGDISITANHLEHLRGIKNLQISTESVTSTLTDDSFKNLRGVKVLKMECESPNVTDAAFINIRGVEELCIARFPCVTSRIIDYLAPTIQCLEFEECPNVKLEAATLCKWRHTSIRIHDAQPSSLLPSKSHDEEFV